MERRPPRHVQRTEQDRATAGPKAGREKGNHLFCCQMHAVLGVHRGTLAIGPTHTKLTVTIGCLALGNTSFQSSRLALGASIPASSCRAPTLQSPDPLLWLCYAFLLLKWEQYLTLAVFPAPKGSRASIQCIRNKL